MSVFHFVTSLILFSFVIFSDVISLSMTEIEKEINDDLNNDTLIFAHIIFRHGK